MRNGGSSVLTTREQAEQLHALRERLEFAEIDAAPFSSTRMFNSLALSGALDVLPAPQECPRHIDLFHRQSPFMQGRAALVEAMETARAREEQQATPQQLDAAVQRPIERPRG